MPDLRVTQARVLRSEWIKFWSLRSSIITLAVGVALVIGFGLIASSFLNNGGPGGGPGGAGAGGRAIGPVAASLAGTTFAQLAFGTLGVLFMASEYSTGMIRSSLTAVPRRLPVLWAKIGVFAAVALIASLAATTIAFTTGQAILGEDGASWSDPGVARAVLGSAVVITASGLVGLALGALLRSTPGAISTLFGVMFLLSGLASLLLPDSWSDHVVKYLPANAADSFTAVTTSAGTLSPTAGLAVFAAYLVVVIAAAALRLQRSDA